MRNILLILLVGMSVGICGLILQHEIPFHASSKEDQTTTQRLQPVPSYQIIQLADAIQFFYKTNSVFVDVRDGEYFNEGHILRSVSAPLNQIQTNSFLLSTLRRTDYCIIYCGGFDCGASYAAASKLISLGVTNVFVYSSGWEEWRACHLPVVIQNTTNNEMHF